jgi:hypothetical protein
VFHSSFGSWVYPWGLLFVSRPTKWKYSKTPTVQKILHSTITQPNQNIISYLLEQHCSPQLCTHIRLRHQSFLSKSEWVMIILVFAMSRELWRDVTCTVSYTVAATVAATASIDVSNQGCVYIDSYSSPFSSFPPLLSLVSSYWAVYRAYHSCIPYVPSQEYRI